MKKAIWLAVCLAVPCFTIYGQADQITGLWLVDIVRMGDQEMTPNAKWGRFNQDGTHESGNGWYQHTVGSWRYDVDQQELHLTSDNGVRDPYGPFTLLVEGEKMSWTRTEEGAVVRVEWKRIDRLPPAYRDQLLGLWKLESGIGEYEMLSLSTGTETAVTLHFQWSGRCIITTNDGRQFGVFNVHGHRPEVEFIPYGDEVKRSFWKFTVAEERLTLELLNSEDSVRRTLVRLDRFPD